MSRHWERMVLHDPGSVGLRSGLDRFLQRRDSILVSPSATTGIDLPYGMCEYQIISKIPYPDMRSKVMRARMKIDPDYPAYIAAQTLVQASGRGMRAEDDQCETFIVDGLWGWFYSRFAQFMPRWWKGAVKRVGRLPAPPKALDPR